MKQSTSNNSPKGQEIQPITREDKKDKQEYFKSSFEIKKSGIINI